MYTQNTAEIYYCWRRLPSELVV